jgi:hypothetical protein
MAQPTVTARPRTWEGTSGPILYKFTSTNSGNAGYYMAVEIWNSLTSLKVADARFYANTANVVTVNVSNFLKDNMSLENSSDLTSGTVYTDTNWIRYYIKYREFWTAGSETLVDDVANLRYAIYGGLQIGSLNSYGSLYVPGDSAKKFLRFAGMAANGYPFTISAIGAAITGVKIDKYINNQLTATAAGTTPLAVNRIRVNETIYDRVDFTLMDTSAETYTNGRATSLTWLFDSVTLGHAESNAVPAGDIDAYHRAYTGTINVPVTLLINVVSSDLSGLVLLNFIIYNFDKSLNANITPIPVTYNGAYVVSVTSGTFAPAFIEILLDNTTAGAVDWDIDVLEEPASETLTISIDEPCDNVVMLQWRNSLGGDECYPFQINQEYTFQYGDRKAKRLTLFAEGLTLTQWEAIQGLNTNGELYKTPITEMLTTDTRTMKTVGQSVNIYNSDGTKTGVNVISQANTTNTKQKTHSAVVTIEYPELYLQ